MEKTVWEPGEKFNDAVCVTRFDLNDYADCMIWVTLAGNQFSENWKTMEIPLGGLFEQMSRHKIGPKIGPAIVFGELVGAQRLKKGMRSCTSITFDLDTGEPIPSVLEKVRLLGCAAIHYTSHSHNSTSSTFPRDQFLKNFPDIEEEDITSALCQKYAREEKKWEERIAETVEFVDISRVKEGRVIRVTHAPIPKQRVCILLKDEFDIDKEGRLTSDAHAKWVKIYDAMARKLGFNYDRSCTDPSRCFNMARHPEGRDDFEINFFGGPLFDWRTLNLDDPFEKVASAFGGTTRKTKTEAGRNMRPWWNLVSDGYLLADALEENTDIYRGSASGGGITIRCPFDDDHSNPGDTNDRACYVLNAQDGPDGRCFIKCQHDGCKSKTTLDHVGKLVEDGVLDLDVLWDEELDIIRTEDQKEKIKAERAMALRERAGEQSSEANPDDTRADYEREIDTLTPEFSDEDLERVIRVVLAAGLSPPKLVKAKQAIAKKVCLTIQPIKDSFKEFEKKNKARAKVALDVLSLEGGQYIFRHEGFNFDEACNGCIAAVAENNKKDKRPTISQFGGKPVRLSILRDGTAKFDDLSKDGLGSELTKRIKFVKKFDQAEGPRESVPRDIAIYIYEQAYDLLDPSPNVVYTPFFMGDGSLLWTAGYHYVERPAHLDDTPENADYIKQFGPGRPYLNHLLLLADGLKIPEPPKEPTREQAMASLNWIKTELLDDFPYCDVDSSGEESRKPGFAHSLSSILTPFSRNLFFGPSPIFMVLKPKGGTGGSLLGRVPIYLYDGLPPKSVRYSANDEEMNKNITTAFKAGRSFMFFDDVKQFTSKEIHRIVGAPVFVGRLLGGNEEIVVQNDKNWQGGGNNVLIDQQMFRRCVFIRLNAKTSNLKGRKFRHGGKNSPSGMTFEKFLEANRGVAISHILTLIQYWINEGMPLYSGTPMQSFENWSEVIGGMLELLGVEGFLEGKDEESATAEIENDIAFVRSWLSEFKFEFKSVADLYYMASSRFLGIVSGKNDDDRRQRFEDEMRRLDGNPFPLEGAKEDEFVDYIVTKKIDKTGTKYALLKAPQK